MDFDDFFAFADVFGQAAVGAAAPFDLDGDGEVGFGDFFLFADLFGLGSAGKSWAAPTVLDEDAVLWPEARGGGRADGGEVVVKVWARDVKGVEGFGLVLEYDAEALRFIDARPGAGHMLASRGGEAPLFRVLGRYPGQVVVGNALIGGEAVAGSGLLAELRFGLKGARQDVSVDLTDAFFAADGQVARVVQLGSARLLPRAYRLGANFPNPFNPATSIEYALPVPGPVRLTVYDVLGRQVRTLVRQQTHAAGVFTALWDGRDAAGRSVGSGVYFYRLAAGKFSQTRRMTLVK